MLICFWYLFGVCSPQTESFLSFTTLCHPFPSFTCVPKHAHWMLHSPQYPPVLISSDVCLVCVLFISLFTQQPSCRPRAQPHRKQGLCPSKDLLAAQVFIRPMFSPSLDAGLRPESCEMNTRDVFSCLSLSKGLSVICRHPGGMDIHGQRSSNREFCAADACRCWT